MVAVRPKDADRYASRPPEGIRLFLVYGPDPGGVTERARQIERLALRRGGGDLVTRFGSDELSADTAKLADEAYSTSLFGGQPVIALRILDGRHNVLGPLTALLQGPPLDSWVVVEAGELRRDSALLRAFEASPTAAAIPAFPLDRGELASLIDSVAAEAGLTVEPGAAELLLDVLGVDRMAARRELEKLCIYIGAGDRVTAAAVEAVVGNLAELRTDAIADAMLAGDAEGLEAGLDRLRAEGGSPAALLSAMLRHLSQLSALSADMRTQSMGASEAIGRARPPVTQRRHAAIKAQLRDWPHERLADARRRIADAILLTRKQSPLELASTSAALHALAHQARRR